MGCSKTAALAVTALNTGPERRRGDRLVVRTMCAPQWHRLATPNARAAGSTRRTVDIEQ
jgi:hypothetical protein